MTKRITGVHKDRLAARLEVEKELAQRSDEGETERAGDGSGNVAAISAVDWLCLAAAPTFAMMALLEGVLGGRPGNICSIVPDASLLSGMVPMYLLMSAFHSRPWLKLIARLQWSRYRPRLCTQAWMH